MLKIHEKPRKEVEFRELTHGDTFMYKDDYYIRCDDIDDGVIDNAVDLSTGMHETFADTCPVCPIDLICEVEE